MLIIPAIDLREGSCVRLRRGRRQDVTCYDCDPVEVAQEFAAQGAQWLHIVDLDGAFAESHSPNPQTLQRIVAAINIPVQFGGGLRSIKDVERVIELGVSRVVLGTLAVESPDAVKQLIDLFGAEGVAVGIDAQHGRVMTRGWEKAESLSAIALARQVASAGVKRIIYTDVARDGMLNGPNIEETCDLARHTGLSVTASGGVSALADLERLKEVEACGVDSVIVGRAIYERRFTVAEAIRAVSGLG